MNILGVRVDKVGMEEAEALVARWLEGKTKHYIVTPNLEFILAASSDTKFRDVLNKSDLAVPDSSRLGLLHWFLNRNFLIRSLLWPLFFFPAGVLTHFDTVPGTDLMDRLCEMAAEKGYTVGFLGGREGVAVKTAECLRKKYSGLKVVFASDGGEVALNKRLDVRSFSNIDLLFVAFGHIKQEKWIAQNLAHIPVKVAMGVGGAFDYLSCNIPRAPKWLQKLGFEWLFRLLVQPWRWRRQLALFKLVLLVLKS